MRHVLVIAVLSLLALPIASAGPAHAPSEVVYPLQSLPIKFSHARHLQLKLRCDFCHDKASTSVSSADDLMPREEACATCHRIDRTQPLKEAKPAARCDSCHVYDPQVKEGDVDIAHPPRVVVPAPNLRFNHKAHEARRIACDQCHGDMSKVDLATRAQLPTMAGCLKCHAGMAKEGHASGRCATCHPQQAEGTLVTTFSSGKLVPSGAARGDAHTIDFNRSHGAIAAQDEAYCGSCHAKSECLSCHDGVVKPMSIHSNDYVRVHAVEARKEALKCDSCHRRQTFCLGCHERTGVVDRATSDSVIGLPAAGKRLHPPYERFVAAPRGPDHHAWAAQRDLQQCVSCHREDSCLQCHATSPARVEGLPERRPMSVNPHPPGFGLTRGCRTMAAHNKRACLKCHAPSDADLDCR